MAGRATSRKDNNNVTTNYVFDDLNRLLEQQYPSGLKDIYTYDPSGNMLTANNANATITFTYDQNNRVLSENLNGKVTTYSYNTLSRKKTITYPSGRIIEEETDVRSRPSAVREDGQAIATFLYDAGNRVTGINYQNGISSNFSYNNVNFNTRVIHNNANPFAQYNYTYDNEGNRLSEEEPLITGRSEIYTYDAAYKLTAFQKGTLSGGVIPNPLRNIQFSFDNTHNRTSTNVDGNTTNYLSNVVNEYQMVGSNSYTYDQNGNLLSDGAAMYQFDTENRLVNYQKSGISTTYKYDALGRRIQKNVNGIITNFFYDQNKLVEQRDGADVVKITYIYGGSWPDHVVTATIAGQKYYYHHNGLTSVIALTNSSGQVVERYEYDPFGVPIFMDGNYGLTSTSTVQNPILFVGRYYDYESKLYYVRIRMYDPAIGRFIRRDPLGTVDGTNLYLYALNNPLNFFDSQGGVAQALAVGATGLVGVSSLPAAVVAALVAAGLIIIIDGVMYITSELYNKVTSCIALYNTYKYGVCKGADRACSDKPGECESNIVTIGLLSACRSARYDYINAGCDITIPPFQSDHIKEIKNIEYKICLCSCKLTNCQTKENKKSCNKDKKDNKIDCNELCKQN